jgi:hypothetical protein
MRFLPWGHSPSIERPGGGRVLDKPPEEMNHQYSSGLNVHLWNFLPLLNEKFIK